MAEESGNPTSEARGSEYWSSRIKEYIDSGKAARHVQEGFAKASQGSFLSLQGFKDRESGRKRAEIGQGQLHQGSTFSQKVTHPECAKSGHDWHEAPNAHLSLCLRCGMERQLNAVEEWLRDEDEDEDEVDRICIWCGCVCVDAEDLEGHEAECEP
jgi:hypothetical protein